MIAFPPFFEVYKKNTSFIKIQLLCSATSINYTSKLNFFFGRPLIKESRGPNISLWALDLNEVSRLTVMRVTSGMEDRKINASNDRDRVNKSINLYLDSGIALITVPKTKKAL